MNGSGCVEWEKSANVSIMKLYSAGAFFIHTLHTKMLRAGLSARHSMLGLYHSNPSIQSETCQLYISTVMCDLDNLYIYNINFLDIEIMAPYYIYLRYLSPLVWYLGTLQPCWHRHLMVLFSTI